MSLVKTKIDSKDVLFFLKKEIDKQISEVGFITGGEMSQAFSYVSNGSAYIIRLYKESTSFEKDRYANKHFNNILLPIPKVISIGNVNPNLFYAISEQAKGKNMDTLTHKRRYEMLPQVMECLDTLHASHIDGFEYGWFDGSGKAKYSSWKENLLAKAEHVEDDFRKSNTSSNEAQKDIDYVYKKLKELVPMMPEIRCLVHADFGGSNMIAYNKKITGVIDWGNAMYGDFLYDVAWLSFWGMNTDYKEEFRKHYIEKGVDITLYDLRILCCQLHMGLGILGFFVLSGQKEKYEMSKNRIFNLMKI